MGSSGLVFGMEKGIMIGDDVVCVEVGEDDGVTDSGTDGT